MTLVNALGNLALDSTVQSVKEKLDGSINVNTQNITTKFREAFEDYIDANTWVQSVAAGDIMALDGNALSASYLVISKDPLSADGNTTFIETVSTFDMPVEIAVGLSMSQRTLGQDFSVEFVSTDTIPAQSELSISSITQSTTTLAVTTSSAHGLVPGNRISISGVPDSRLNYPSLVVTSVVSAFQFIVTAGPAGAIPSVTAGPFTSGVVTRRSTLGFAQDGTSMIFENATATNASIYLRSSSGDTLPSGTVNGNQSVTIATTASAQLLNSAFAYTFVPTSEYRLNVQADRVQWYDIPVDSLGTSTSRMMRTQVCPTPSKQYKIRFRFTNNKGRSVPVAQIVSVTKSGTTTATVVTDVPHRLTTTDQVNIFGVRDQTNFANLTAATAISSIVNSTTFTISFGSAATASSFGGYVARVNSGNTMAGYGAITQSVQSIINSVDGSITRLLVTGSATWSGLSIGDYVNAVGLRISDGSATGADGVYRVANIVTTQLILEPVGSTATPNFPSTINCGGGIIKRTDARISFVRVFDFLRERVEMLARPNNDASASSPVLATQNGTWNIGTVTTVASLNQLSGIQTSTMPYDSQHTTWANTTRRAVT